MSVSEIDIEDRLRDQRFRAAELPPVPRDLAQRVRERARVERRRHVTLAAAGIAAALVFVGLPVLASTLTPEETRTESAAPSASREPVPSHLDLPTRGSLAGDEDWLTAVRTLSWAPENPETYPPEIRLPDPDVEDRTVVFAGDVPGGRLALVVAETRIGQLVHAWFAGPERARPSDMRLASAPGSTSRQEPLAVVAKPDPGSDELVLVLVAHPGDEAEVLTGREVAATGEIRDLLRPVPLEDGAGALALGSELPIPPVLDIRITRLGQTAPVFPQLAFSDELFTTAMEPVSVADPRGLLRVVDAEELQWSVQSLAGNYGLPADRLRPTLLAGGPISPGSSTEAVLVGITFPSGATTAHLTVYWAENEQGAMTSMTQLDPAPAGTALLDRLIAVATSNAVVVSAPPTGVTAEVLRDDGTLLTTVPLVDGAGSASLLPPPRPYGLVRLTVRVLDGSGSVVAESTVEQQG